MSKEKLNAAFASLRRKGYFARQNFKCCQTCAWAEIRESHAKRAVFYHTQDANDLRNNSQCYVAWAGNPKEIVDIFKHHGIDASQKGKERILIKI